MDDDYSDWFRGKTLTTDWTSHNFPTWASLLAARRDLPLAVLEIGSWEGRSAIFFLQYLRRCRITCVDTFAGSPEHFLEPNWQAELPLIEQRFDSNLAEFGERMEKLKDTSARALARLQAQDRHFDLVYVDGSHRSADVELDARLSWPMVREGGLVIFDDYEWSLAPEPTECPRLGIDTFLSGRTGEYRELHRGYQLIVEKIRS
jgi:predicted O-methyltransferase YrrM